MDAEAALGPVVAPDGFAGSAAVFIVWPSQIQPGRSAYQRVFVTFAAAAWDGGTVFLLSGVSGVAKVGQIVDSPTQAYIVITTSAAAAKSTQTLTVSDGTNGGTTLVTPIAPTRRRWC
jgi:hypothetical protein